MFVNVLNVILDLEILEDRVILEQDRLCALLIVLNL